MRRVFQSGCLRDALAVCTIAAATLMLARTSIAGVFGVKCNLYIAGCNTVPASCCVAVGTQYSTSTPTGQTLSAAAAVPATQCAAQLEQGWFGYWCGEMTGVCGGAATTAACD